MANIINFPSGKVGIGTENPQQTLDIAGTLRLSGSTGTGTTLMARNASGDVSAVTIGAGLNLSNNSLTATGGGTGTVSGSGTATQIAFWDGATGTTSSSLASSANLYWDNVNGRLGVGTNAPTTRLDVSGTARVQGTTTITPAANTSAITSTGYSVTGSDTTRMIDLSGTWNTSGNVTAINLDITNTASGANSNLINCTINGTTTIFSVRRSGEVSAQNLYSFHSSNGTIQVASALSLVTAPSQTPGIFLNKNGSVTATSGDFPTVTLNSTVNSFAPTSGNATFTSMRVVPTINQTGGASGTTRGVHIQPTLTSAADWRSIEWTNNTGWGLYGSGTANNYLGGSLGVGVVTPAAQLQVHGTNTSDTGWTAQFHNSLGNSNSLMIRNDGNVGVGTSGTTARFVVRASGSSTGSTAMLIQNSGGTTLLRVREDGNVGIGTAEPTNKLYVDGSTYVGSLTVLGSINSIGGNIFLANTRTIQFGSNTSIIGQDGSSGFIRYTVNNNEIFRATTSSIGIGTITPAQTLDIAGTMRLTGSTGTGTTLMARNADGDVSAVTVGSGLNLANNTLTATGGGSGTVSGSGTATQVAFWDNTTSLAGNSNLYWDNVNGRLGVGITTPTSNLDVVGSVEFQNPSTDYDGGVLGSELLTTGTGTNWTGSGFATGYLHVTGSTVALVSSASISSGQFYQVVVTVSGRTTGSITFSIGGYINSSIATNTTTTVGPLTTSTNSFTVTPTTDFNGTVSASVKVITAGSVSFVGKNSSGTTVYEERISSFNSNIFQGINAGRLNTTGIQNVFQGANAGSSNTTGSNNLFIGNSSGSLNTVASNNIFIGTLAGYLNTIGDSNTFIGAGAGRDNTSGNNNFFLGRNTGLTNTTGANNLYIGVFSGVFSVSGGSNVYLGGSTGRNNVGGSSNVLIGLNAGRYYSESTLDDTSINNSVFIGAETRSTLSGQTNQIIIANNGRGLGSNTTVIGNTSTVQTHLHGSLTLGSTSSPTARMVVVGSGSSDTGWTAQFHNVLGNSNSLMIRDDGNVGIGTSAPSARLQINAFGTGSTASAFLIQNSASTSVFSVRDNGDIYGTNTLTLSATKPSINIVGSGISNLDSWGINFNYGVSNKFVILYSEYDKQIFFKGASSNASLILNQDNSNVGINIPAGSLVRSQFVVAGNSYIASGDGIANARLHVLGSGTTNTGWTAQFHNSGGTNNSLMIRNDGNVGIGTDAPAQTLHVAGTMRLTGSTGTGTTLMARNANGDVSAVTLGTGVVLSNNVISVALSPKAETPSGLVNGSNITYTLTSTPIANESVMVFLNGVAQYNGIDYTVSGTTITFGAAPANGSSIFAYYMA